MAVCLGFSEPGEDYSPVQSFITDIIFFTGSCYSCSTPCDACEKLNFAEITKRVSTNEFMHKGLKL